MRRAILVVVMLVSSCSRDKLVPTRDPRCDTPCYAGSPTNAGRGVCNMGLWKCYDDRDPECLGSGSPQAAICNGLDNDCDGEVDSPSENCNNPCGKGLRFCISGVWSSCRGNEANPEICNNKDDDCNGIVDDIPVEFCYTGNPKDLIFADSQCSPGVWACTPGVGYPRVCSKQVLPSPEKCDYKDNDCNGIVDDGISTKPRDIIVCIDNSGSMGQVIGNIKTTTTRWALKYAGRSDLRFALEECPGPWESMDGKVRLVQNFTDASIFNMKVANEFAGVTGNEPTLDAIYMSADPVNPLMLNWRAGAERTLIMFSDEEAQSWMPVEVTVTETADFAAAAKIRVFVFTTPSVANTYSPLDTKTGGKIFDIHMSSADMELELDHIISPCP